jgi:SAM-dependent methyltransferase
MKLNPEDLAKITDFTLSHYNEHAEDFWEGTRDHNVSQNITALLQSIEGEPPYTILDFGCGPGRDLKVFAELGHIAVGLDGAPHFAVMARAHIGCEDGSRIFLSSICRIAISTAYSPTPHCFTYPARSYRVCC